jgi:hypothetical protein
MMIGVVQRIVGPNGYMMVGVVQRIVGPNEYMMIGRAQVQETVTTASHRASKASIN